MELPENGYHELDCYFTWMGHDGIARTLVKKDAEIELKDAKKNSEVVNGLRPTAGFPLIVETSEIKSITKEARDYLSIQNRETKISAIAIVRDSIIGNMVANFFIGLNKPAVPTKLFSSEEDAIKWCQQHKN